MVLETPYIYIFFFFWIYLANVIYLYYDKLSKKFVEERLSSAKKSLSDVTVYEFDLDPSSLTSFEGG